ncbi:sigma factor-like helix-turn-helix DNA-binding protein [Sphingomonas sp. NIBR02145]|uniref:sigma factor-like helix-turn-helix DNA-binding protein n=1 Tax=Sphingomonas sp. NIBR02145 TaxID=3014784 RepID=UPI0022B53967|nr:sigma factor-like helix-turn-helix DNA-binding protein [Sphingomonas sp. NIBR02145]WHU03668.1 sigma factor-like helix-turn-helix DNA-binding protein [Sphingomonas sp. NIBR02145]
MEQELPVAELLRRIQSALDTMAPLPRAVFDAARYRDLEYPQIAAELGISIAEVERNLSLALIHIDHCVMADGGP